MITPPVNPRRGQDLACRRPMAGEVPPRRTVGFQSACTLILTAAGLRPAFTANAVASRVAGVQVPAREVFS